MFAEVAATYVWQTVLATLEPAFADQDSQRLLTHRGAPGKNHADDTES
jgi:hypothetical protein